MEKTKLLLAITMTLILTTKVFSQNFYDECGLDAAMKELGKNDPDYYRTEAELLEFTQKFIQNKANKQTEAQYIIPVVVHIVHENGLENIPSENILDMLRIVNEDYQRRQADTAQAVPPFNAIIGKLDIEFRLATKDPNGNCTNGITRTYDPIFTNSGQGIRPIVWPQDKYLNIWIVKSIGSGAAAYSYFPSNNNPNDGVVCLYDGMGSLPPASSNSDARRMPHEIGHYLNLRHPWGDGNGCGDPSNCNTDDGISDTPNTLGFCGGCNNSYTTCGTLDNSQNIMDYGNCEMMFTQGQMNWAEAALNSSVGQRNNLWSQANLSFTGTDSLSYAIASCPPTADFGVNKTKSCEGETFNFSNKSFHAFADKNSFIYNWTFNGASIQNSSLKDPTVTYNSAGLFDVSLSVSMPNTNADTMIRTDLMEIVPGSGNYIGPYLEQFSDIAWPNNNDTSLNWDITKPQGSIFQFQRSTAASFSAPSSVYLNNFSHNNNGAFDLITPIADLTQLQAGNAFLNFQIAHAQKSNELENLFLWVSTDCGESFDFIKVWNTNIINTAPATSNAFIPTDTSQWSFVSYDISNYAGMDNVQFMFRLNANSGNNLWLDDIHISDSDQPVPLTTGIRKELFGEFNLYPNPNSGLFTIQFYHNGNDKISAEIIDIIGQSIQIDLSKTIQSGWNTVRVNSKDFNLKPGVYFIKLTSGDNSYSKRFIIK
ncbi:MAG: M43 family zinc metalloprotease [Cytophagales bacterium]